MIVSHKRTIRESISGFGSKRRSSEIVFISFYSAKNLRTFFPPKIILDIKTMMADFFSSLYCFSSNDLNKSCVIFCPETSLLNI